MKKLDIVKHILHTHFTNNSTGYGWAPSNVALCKYWGKRNTELNLPVTSSLSISLGNKGTFTHIVQNTEQDQYTLNDIAIAKNTKFAQRLKKFLNLFRPAETHYTINIHSNIPTATGLASSACGFASLVQALNNLHNWQLSKTELSILARLGSGSACRSIWDGFVEWQAGTSRDGMDSHGIPLTVIWPKLRIGVILLSSEPKAISSTEAMKITRKTSPQYRNWPLQAAQDLVKIKTAITEKDFALLGETAENNAVAMHTMMLHATPPIVYSLLSTTVAMQKVWELRDNGIPVFFTQDAGPNLQILFPEDYSEAIVQTFPDIEIIAPFTDTLTSLILVDATDNPIGSADKLSVHQQGKLHRAFSIFIVRTVDNKTEVLLQQRSSNKYHSANLWSNTCCGHPKPGENTIDAAKKRLQEEMGFTTELHTIGSFKYMAEIPEVNLIEHEFDHVFIGQLDDNAQIMPNVDEVQSYRWIELSALKQDLQQNPNIYTKWLDPALELVLNYASNSKLV